jgi:ElaB/YqjD/DUF883 family membrane-anchored ribosome-binding protein
MDLKTTDHADQKTPLHDGALDKNGAAPKGVLEELRQAAPAASADQAGSAANRLKTVAHAAEALVKRHPVATAGVLLGAGAAIGAVAEAAFRHQPTVGEVVLDALKTSASRVSKQVSSAASKGLSAGKAKARRALR